MERKPPNIDFQKRRPEATEEKKTPLYLQYFDTGTISYNCPYTATTLWDCCACDRPCPNRGKAKFNSSNKNHKNRIMFLTNSNNSNTKHK